MHHRRAFLAGAGAFLVAPPAHAAERKIWRVGGKRIKVVDIHAHIAPDMSALIGDTPFQAKSQSNPQITHRIEPPRIARMDVQGIDVEVLSVNPYWYDMERELASRFIAAQNAQLADIIQADPARFYALASVSLQFPDLAVAQLQEALTRHRLSGVSLGCTIAGEELSSPRFDPFWKECEARQVAVFLHPQDSANATGVTRRVQGAGSLTYVIAHPLETTIALSHLIFEGTLDRFPGLRICAAHGGGFLPSYIGRSDFGCTANPQSCSPKDPVLKKKPSDYMHQIYVDALVFTPEATRHLAAVVGPRRMMIGTDSPIPWTENPVETVLATPGLSDGDKIAILGGTACKLFNIAV
jgi:aminocarboxymuconate-semialdehyde decarboxylase